MGAVCYSGMFYRVSWMHENTHNPVVNIQLEIWSSSAPDEDSGANYTTPQVNAADRTRPVTPVTSPIADEMSSSLLLLYQPNQSQEFSI